MHKCITLAKRAYKQHIEDNFNESNSHAMWQGIKSITYYKQSNSIPSLVDPSLLDQLNTFFVRFENCSNFNKGNTTAPESVQSLQTHQVKRTLQKNQLQKSSRSRWCSRMSVEGLYRAAHYGFYK